MSRLSNLDKTIENAVKVLVKPTTLKFQVFEKVNGKRTSKQIAALLKKQLSNVSNVLTNLCDNGVIEDTKKKIHSPLIYEKIPELRKKNLHPYFKKGRKGNESPEELFSLSDKFGKTSSSGNTVMERVLNIGSKYGITNIDQNWVDCLIILNFIETAASKFLMDHDFPEKKVRKMNWEEKLSRLENKLQEEAAKAGITLRTATLIVIKNYRTQRNNVDHIAHLSNVKIKKPEVQMLRSMLNLFVKEIFEGHSKYCQNP